MALEKYREKRDFTRTHEPEGKVEPGATGTRYVIQKHAASHLHYDLRLELDGVLKSWAIPKGPSMVSGEKRLAVHVEDHPPEYGSFEGIIPENEYGGGTVMLWDRGTWEPIGDPHEGYAKGDLKFRLNGEKLKGAWVLAAMKGQSGEKGKNWLLIKKRDEYALSPSDPEPVEALDRSVATGMSMQEIAAERKKVWLEGRALPGTEAPAEDAAKAAGKSRKRRQTTVPSIPDPSTVPGALPAPQPETFRPELATLVSGPPRGDNWLHEIKYDGYRILCMISDGRIRLVSRNGKDWTLKFVKIYESALHIPVKDAIIDGEIVAVDPRGRPNFQALQNILKGIGGGRLVYYAFDIPHCMGYDLTRTPLIERKDFLRRVLETCSVNGSHIRYADHIRGDGSTVFVHSCRLALEGIVSKQADSPYEQTRSRRWVKVKCFHRQEFVIGGFTEPGGSRTGFGALLLGHYDPSGNLVYSGKVGTGFNDKMLSVLAPRLTSMETDTPPLINPPAGYGTKRVHWVRPELVAEVEYSERTEQGILRHPSFKGLREDKDPKEVVREDPESPLPAGPAPKPSGATNRPLFPKGEPMENISSVSLSNPDRILYPEMGITKRVLAEYYSDVSPWMLPHVQRRPLTLVRCPEGWRAGCFFQKHPGDMAPKALRSIPVMGKDGLEYYSVADDAEGLTALVQMGALEIHIWGSREEKLEQPDTMIFDLDPDPSVHWEQMIAAACLLRDRLSDLGLESFLKTTGGKGLHVAVPLTPRGRWDEVKEFSRTVAGSIVRESPREYIATMSKAKRKGKIFIDYLRNGRGATFIAPYSTRAKRGAPISAPVGWGELGMDLRPDTYNIENIRKRLSSLAKDPWEGFYSVRQSITRKMKKKLGMSSQ